MVASSIVDSYLLWELYIIAGLFVLLTTEIGWRLGNYSIRRHQDEKNAPVGAAVGATMGLLAFLLAFTFSMSATRFDNRKQIVLQEANSIGTTYLRVDFLPETMQDEARALLRDYAILRSGGANVILTPDGMARSAALQDRLWEIADRAEQEDDSVATGLFIESLNQMIDMEGARVTALRNRIPDTIWLMLILVTMFSMAALGYQFGLTGARSWPTIIFLILVFAPVILLIADLDRAQAGLIRISQQPLLDLIERIGMP